MPSTLPAPRPRRVRPSTARDAEPGIRDGGVDGWVGPSGALQAARAAVQRYAPVQAPVLIRGQTGTGKELAAEAIHHHSGRPGRLVAVNCGGISTSLVHSHLFGHVRGAFTGASNERRGAFAQAQDGTLFLDELGELPLPCQALLLRALETREVQPVGSEHSFHATARIVCATHQDLEAMVAEGRFRADLFHRLSVLSVTMPSLAERPEDVGPLLVHFARQLQLEVGHPIRFTRDAVEAATRGAWPGNVRQLRNAVLRAALVAGAHPIDAASLMRCDDPTAGQGRIELAPGPFLSMRRALIEAVVAREGSIRKASAVLQVPRSTLGNWLRAAPPCSASGSDPAAADDHGRAA
ncbi:MAG: sigma 54-interacting transcriptional regulator [Myxococcota bacterium]